MLIQLQIFLSQNILLLLCKHDKRIYALAKRIESQLVNWQKYSWQKRRQMDNSNFWQINVLDKKMQANCPPILFPMQAIC